MIAATVLALDGCPSQPSTSNTPAAPTPEPDPVCELATGPATFDVSFLSRLYVPSSSTSASVPATVGTTYYVDATLGADANSGTSPDSAWKTLYHVSHASLQPGDCVLLKRGETWKDEVLDVPASGAADRPIIFGAYGSGAKPIIDATVPVPGALEASTWTAFSDHVWSMTPPYNEHPGRLWLSGSEHVKAKSLDTLDSTYRWFYDYTEPGKLYVWADSNPASAYTSIVKAWSKGNAMVISGRNHVIVQNLDLRGGGHALQIQGSDYVTVEYCDVGWGSHSCGVWITELANNPNAGASDHGILRHNRIDSGFRLQYNYEKAQTEDGIHMRSGVNDWEIVDNEISNWGHTGIVLWQQKAETTVNHNRIRRNYMTANQVSYGRGFSTSGRPGGCSHNEFVENIVRDTAVPNQIGGDHNTVKYNLIDTIRTTPIAPMGSVGLTLQTSMFGKPDYVADHNEIANNLVYGTDGPGIYVVDQPDASVRYNVVRNNLLLDTGSNYPDCPNVALRIGISYQPPDNPVMARFNVYKDNLMFNRHGPNLVFYRGKRVCPGSFSTLDGLNGDTCSGNLLIDPRLVAPEAHDFSRQPDSPLR